MRADHQAGVAALRHDGRAGRGAGLAPRRPLLRVEPGRTTASALPRARLRQSCSQALRSPSVSTWAAPTMARSWSISVVHGLAPCAGAAARAARRPRTAPGTAATSSSASARAQAAVAPGAHHAFGEIEPDQQADPAVGVHAVAQQAGQRDAQRQHLERQPGAARPQRRQPQLPGQAQHDQAQQAADGEPAGGVDGGRGVRRAGGRVLAWAMAS